MQAAFVTETVLAERAFYAKPYVGYDPETGWTYDGITIDPVTGRVFNALDSPRVFTAASKEALQLSLLALSIPGVVDIPNMPYPYTEEETLSLLAKKASAYEDFSTKYPEFRGWLPWMCSRGIVDGKCATVRQPATGGAPSPGESYRELPGYDNGEYAWAIYTLSNVLATRASQPGGEAYQPLAEAFEKLLTQLRLSAVDVWFHDGQICGTAALLDEKEFLCKGDDRLTDPFEGELLLIFVDLLGDWGARDHGGASSALWAAKQATVVKRNLYGVDLQAGWHFSAHEQWKLLMLPYLDLPKTKEIMLAGEVARSRYSLIEGIPGLLGDANEPVPDDPHMPRRPGCPTGYCKSVGIQPLAQAPVDVNWTVTPYAAFPMVLVDRSAGLAWYNAMLRAPRMQTIHGAGEAISADGSEVSSALTWDTKALILVALYGGMGPVVKPYMVKDNIYDEFQQRVETMYTTIFGPVTGVAAMPALPHMFVDGSAHEGYPSCRCSPFRPLAMYLLPVLAVYIAGWGGQMTAIARAVIGGLAGVICGARLNVAYAVFGCDVRPDVKWLETCRAIDDPIASAILLGLFGVMLCVRSLRFALFPLVTTSVMTLHCILVIALPVGARLVLVRPMFLVGVFGICVCAVVVLIVTPAFTRYSYAVTGTLSAFMGSGLLVAAIWGIQDVDIYDPLWTGAEEGMPMPFALWTVFSGIFLIPVVQVFSRAYSRVVDANGEVSEGEGSNVWECEGLAEERFYRRKTLPYSPEPAPRTNSTGPDSNGGGTLPVPLLEDQQTADGAPTQGLGSLRSTGSLANMSGSDRQMSVPDMSKLAEEALREERQRTMNQLDPRPDLPPTTEPRFAQGPVMEEGLLAEHKDGWLAVVYLWSSVLLTLVCVTTVPFTVDWASTNLVVGLIFCVLSWFLLWNVTDLFISTIAYHAVRVIFDFAETPRVDLLTGLPDDRRTCIMFCLLSDNKDQSRDTWENAYECYMNNLDPNANMSVALISVSNKISIVEAEVDICAGLQQRFLLQLQPELDSFLAYVRALGLPEDKWAPPQQEIAPPPSTMRVAMSPGVARRYYFWSGLAQRLANGPQKVSFKNAKEAMRGELETMAKQILYLHRNSRVLKKPGQYQDAIVLAATGDNKAYTYTDSRYGKLGRKPDESCFGFTGNIVKDKSQTEEEFHKAIKRLQKRGEVHIQRLVRSGETKPFRYSMVMDADTVSEWRSVLRLIEYAVANPSHGIFQCALSLDDSAPGQTWYMWAESLRQASNVNLPKAHWTIFQRHGFYGKGLFDNEMMIKSVIGTRPAKQADGTYQALEALPVDIMSHDTFEAKILKPCFVSEVMLREEPAKNALSSFPQTTRWMVGEVRNASYPPGLFRVGIICAQRLYGLFNLNAPRPPFLRQHDIPVAWGTDYIAHISFRVMHAGPAIMLIILMKNYSAAVPGLLSFRNQFLSIPLTLFTLFSLFILPKGLLVLDMVPSLKLGRRNREPGFVYEPSFDNPEGKRQASEFDRMSGASLFWHKIFLSFLEAVLSALVFGPECLVGFHRSFLAYSAQITGKVAWRPQAAVDKEVEESTLAPDVTMVERFMYCLRNSWGIPTLGAFIAITSMCFGICEPFSIVLWVSWLLHPVIVTWGCSPLPSPEESSMVRMVRKVRKDQNL
jgi:hypothetical protein